MRTCAIWPRSPAGGDYLVMGYIFIAVMVFGVLAYWAFEKYLDHKYAIAALAAGSSIEESSDNDSDGELEA